MILSDDNTFNFLSEVVEPFTKNPLEISEIANGFPSHPHPKILIIFIKKTVDLWQRYNPFLCFY
jgi:hypothetical protein